jgi:hypothetical protein
VIEKAALPSGSILQVVQVVKTDSFTTTSATFTAVTGLSATITPRSTTSKILITAQVAHGLNVALGYGHFKMTGGNTAAYVGDTAGSRIAAVFGGSMNADERNNIDVSNIVYLDSPATSSAVTYQLEVRQSGSGTVFINRTTTDIDNAFTPRGASTITLMEVAG